MRSDELEKIERLWSETTPGEWRWIGGEEDWIFAELDEVVVGAMNGEGLMASRENLRAIACAPEHIRSLLAEVRRLAAKRPCRFAECDPPVYESDACVGFCDMTAARNFVDALDYLSIERLVQAGLERGRVGALEQRVRVALSRLDLRRGGA